MLGGTRRVWYRTAMRAKLPIILTLILLLAVTCASTREAPASPPDGDDSPPPPETTLHVSRSATCRGVADHEPVDPATEFQLSDDRVYLWCEVENAQGTTITHVYSLEGEPVTTVPLAVGTARYRTWSYKQLHPGHAGAWRAEIIAEDGTVLATHDFIVHPSDG